MTKTASAAPVPGIPEPEGALSGLPIAMAYVPVQRFKNLADPETALSRGTVFNDLFKPLECGSKRRTPR